MNFLKEIITDVLKSLYTNFGSAVIIAILFMYAFLVFREKGFVPGVKKWFSSIVSDREFRRVFILALFTSLMLCRTLLGRAYWTPSPLRNVFGVWGMYDGEGKLYIENIENVILFLPFTLLMLWALGKRMFIGRLNLWNCIKSSLFVSIIFSVLIESCQLFFKLGDFQISDLVFNTLGGFLGGLIYWAIHKIRSSVNKNKGNFSKNDLLIYSINGDTLSIKKEELSGDKTVVLTSEFPIAYLQGIRDTLDIDPILIGNSGREIQFNKNSSVKPTGVNSINEAVKIVEEKLIADN